MNLLQQVGDQWVQAMEARAVHLSAPGDDMLRLDAIEVGPQHSKPRTNVLLHRSPGGEVWEFYVDDDLDYLGDDEARRRLFRGPKRRHWLALTPPRPVRGSVHEAVLQLLAWLDSPMRENLPASLPAERTAPPQWDADLDGLARRLEPADLADEGFAPTVAQAEAIAHIAAGVTRTVAPCCPVVSGLSGCGKHVVAYAAAAALVARGIVQQVVEVSGASVDAGPIFRTQKDDRLGRVLDAVRRLERPLVLLDHFDAVLDQSEIAAALVTQHLDRGLKLVALTRGEFALERNDVLLPLRRRLQPVALRPMDVADTVAVLRQRLPRHPLAGQVELAAGLLPAIARAAGRRPGVNPGAAIDLLDALLAQAAWSDVAVVGPDDLLHLSPQGDHADD